MLSQAAMTQRSKAQILLDLHHRPWLLILPNVWNPIGARLLAAKGSPAVVTFRPTKMPKR